LDFGRIFPTEPGRQKSRNFVVRGEESAAVRQVFDWSTNPFAREITRAPRKWAERTLRNLVYWNDCSKGGHFAAWEQPRIFVEEVRKCFALMR